MLITPALERQHRGILRALWLASLGWLVHSRSVRGPFSKQKQKAKVAVPEELTEFAFYPPPTHTHTHTCINTHKV